MPKNRQGRTSFGRRSTKKASAGRGAKADPASSPGRPGRPKVESQGAEPDGTAHDDGCLREYLRVFEQLFFSFRQEVLASFGEKGEEVISRAEETIRLRT